VLRLVPLSTVAILFDLDIVLGAFAAGFVLHPALPEVVTSSWRRS
jgi:hypothetical protein